MRTFLYQYIGTSAHWYIGIFVYFILLSSCNLNKTEISGTLENASNDTLFLEKLGKTFEKFDSTVTDKDGDFKFSFETQETSFYRLRLKNRQTIVLLLHPKEKLAITAYKDSLALTYQVEGSEDCSLIQELNQKQQNLEKLGKQYEAFRRGLLAGMKNDTTKAKRDSLMKVMMVEEKKLKDNYHAYKLYIKEFVSQHPNSLASLIASARLDPNEDYEYLKKLDSTLTIQYPNSIYLTDFHKKVESLKVFAIGNIPPDITLPDLQGKMVSLSSLKGNVVLLNFWSSINKQSRAENHFLANLYKNYHDKGLEVYSVAFDLKKEDWINAIRQDSLPWTNNVSDVKGMNSQAAKDYKISAKNLPYTILLDREGKIIAKGLKGIELETKAKEMLPVSAR